MTEKIGALGNGVIYRVEDIWTEGSLKGTLCYDVLASYNMDYPVEEPVFDQNLLEPGHYVSRQMHAVSHLPWLM